MTTTVSSRTRCGAQLQRSAAPQMRDLIEVRLTRSRVCVHAKQDFVMMHRSANVGGHPKCQNNVLRMRMG